MLERERAEVSFEIPSPFLPEEEGVEIGILELGASTTLGAGVSKFGFSVSSLSLELSF
jgi:hypothetical protein